jgi:HAD superfamily hydrolase (TIGR01509 family)
MKVEALVFDVDGTLADTEEQHRRAFNATFDHFDLNWHWSRADYVELLKVAGGKQRLASFIASLPLGADEKARLDEMIPVLHAEKTRRYTAAIASGAPSLRPGVAPLLSEARASGVKLAIASTTTRENVDGLLGASGFREGWFDVIVCGGEVPHMKPAPDVYELVLRKLGLLPSQAIAFEDSAVGLRSATLAGLWTVVTPTFWTRADAFGPSFILESLEGMTLAELTRRRTAVP